MFSPSNYILQSVENIILFSIIVNNNDIFHAFI